MSGTPSAAASPRAVAIPIRSPVNVPGPAPTTIRSSSDQLDPAALEHLGGQRQQPPGVARARARGRDRHGPRARRAPSQQATDVARVEVSRASSLIRSIATSRSIAAGMLEADPQRRSARDAASSASDPCGHSTNAIVSGRR